jgi:hypothetical protein
MEIGIWTDSSMILPSLSFLDSLCGKPSIVLYFDYVVACVYNYLKCKKINLKQKHILGIMEVIMIYTNALIRSDQYSMLNRI